ncbi:MAG: hypothetical protein AABX89_03275 [Candidatus Thermoplasmatota archaeon]
MAESNYLHTGRILLVVGGVLQLVGAMFAVILLAAAAISFPLAWFAIVVILLSVPGAICSLVGHSQAQKGNAEKAFVYGLVGSLLPPVALLPLLGAVLCKLSPEAAASRSPSA